jgi:hypothetical protein
MTDETPKTALARIVEPLDATRAATVREAFGNMFDLVDGWHEEAAQLVVTDESQTGKMARARSLRLEIKNARVELDKRRKALKAGILVEGRAIDGAFAIFESLSGPLESRLLEQEKFAERAEATRRDALRDARKVALLALGTLAAALPASLGEMSEEAWRTVLADAEAAQEARVEQARIVEAAKVEASRLEAERAAERATERRKEAIRVEAERQAREAELREDRDRLKAEAETKERERAAERDASEAERKRLYREGEAERLKARQAEEAANAAELQKRLAREEEARLRLRLTKLEEEKAAAILVTTAPAVTTPVAKSRTAVLVAALQRIAGQATEPRSAELARAALVEAGVHAPTARPSAIETVPAPSLAEDADDFLGIGGS